MVACGFQPGCQRRPGMRADGSPGPSDTLRTSPRPQESEGGATPSRSATESERHCAQVATRTPPFGPLRRYGVMGRVMRYGVMACLGGLALWRYGVMACLGGLALWCLALWRYDF